MNAVMGKSTQGKGLSAFVVVVPAVALLFALASAMLGPAALFAGGALGAAWALVLGLGAARLSRAESRAAALANGSLFAATVAAGFLAGGSLFDLLLLSLSVESPAALMRLFHAPYFDTPNLYFIVFNTLLEALLVPAALYLNWQQPRRRGLILLGAALYYLQRAVTYVYFVPLVYGFAGTPAEGPFSAELVAQVAAWVKASWLRFAPDALLLAALARSAFWPAAPRSVDD